MVMNSNNIKFNENNEKHDAKTITNYSIDRNICIENQRKEREIPP